MPIFVVEIEKRPVVAFHDDDDDIELVQMYVDQAEWLKSDLMVYHSQGKPLWDGESDLEVRRATRTEKARHQASKAKAYLDGDLDPGDDDWLCFLVPIYDPDDDEDTDEDDGPGMIRRTG